MSISYFKHFFNGLDIFFSTPHIKNIFADHTLFSTFNYSIWFLVLIHLVRIKIIDLDFTQLISVIGLILPVLLAVPVVIEVRYFLPAHILAYGVIAFGFDYKGILKSFLYTKWEIAHYFVLYLLWLIVCFTLSSSTIESLVIP